MENEPLAVVSKYSFVCFNKTLEKGVIMTQNILDALNALELAYGAATNADELTALSVKVKELEKQAKERFKAEANEAAKTDKDLAKRANDGKITEAHVKARVVVRYKYGSGKNQVELEGVVVRAPSADKPNSFTVEHTVDGVTKKLPRTLDLLVSVGDLPEASA